MTAPADAPMKSRGFTLVELLVVILIIGVLAAISYPVIRASVAKSKQATCLSNLRNVGVGLESYLQDHNRVMPMLAAGRSSKTDDTKVLETELAPYLTNPDVFHCPADAKEFTKSGSSYLWNTVESGLPENKLSFLGLTGDTQRIPLVADKEAWHPGPMSTNILYADLSASRDLRFVTQTP